MINILIIQKQNINNRFFQKYIIIINVCTLFQFHLSFNLSLNVCFAFFVLIMQSTSLILWLACFILNVVKYRNKQFPNFFIDLQKYK